MAVNALPVRGADDCKVKCSASRHRLSDLKSRSTPMSSKHVCAFSTDASGKVDCSASMGDPFLRGKQDRLSANGGTH